MRTLFAVLLCCLSSLAWTEAFFIKDFHADINLQADGAIRVKESIQIIFTEPRHGIYRDIPIYYDAGRGITRQMILENIEVSVDGGASSNFQKSVSDFNLRLKIGDKNVYVQPNQVYTYHIDYTVLGAVKWFDGTSDWEPVAELYWNVVGTKWDVNIEHSSFRLTFPIVAGGKGLRAQVYTGVFGSSLSHALTKLEANSTSDRTNTIMTLDDRSLECERTTRLNPTEGLTVVLNLPAALVAKPGFWENFRTTVLPNIGYGLPIFASLGMLLLWFTYGRDPRGGPVVVQFEPPDGMSGSELGAMIDERVDNRDIAAAFVTLATKGLLTFEATEGTFFSRPETSLALTGKDPTGLLPFEMYVYAQLSAIGQVIDPTALRTEFATQISTVKELLYSRLVDRGYYNQSPNQSRVVWGCLGVLMIGFLGLITFGLTPMQLPTPTVVGAFLSLIPLIWFVMQMPRRTFQGARVRQQVLGFADFIRRAKGNQIEWAVKKKVDMATYEEYLPHAIALGLAHEWTDAFSSVLTSPPNWYHSPYNTFYPGAFANDLTSSTNSLASAATTMPRSSGSSGFGGGGGGGGFSGGGGGGGGGGSW